MFVFTARLAAGAIGPATGDQIMHAREGPDVEATDPLRWSNSREIPAVLGPVRPGSVSRARLLWVAAALLLEAIATDAPGDPDASVLALEHGLGLTEPLTNSETRVLHYLPTYMGVPEIAATLYLSANTVKTHVRHLYRKLGVHSRQEAVQRARALGLVAAKASHPTRGQPRSTGTEEWIMSYGHAERNLATLRQLEAETRELMASLDQLNPERSAWLQEVTSSGDDSLK
jgi:DNA-binding CsgD family transcriptional regulator